MLRSIFSLIQRIIDSDKQYNNTKSRAVIYCLSNPDNSVNMDLQIDGKTRKTIKTLQNQEASQELENTNVFQLKTEHGDTVSCLHSADKKITPKLNENETNNDDGDRATFINTEEVSERGKTGDLETQPHVHDLLKKFPENRIKFLQKDKDQVTMLLEQINKMKAGLQRLHDIAHQFNCSEKFAQDLNYLRANLKKSLSDGDSEEKDLSKKL